MIDLFETPKIDLTKLINHSGGAEGSDTYWEKIGEEYIREYTSKRLS